MPRHLERHLADLVAGLATIGVGAFIAIEAAGYRMGTLRDMGPGYFPAMLGTVMCGLGAWLIIRTFGQEPARIEAAVDKRGIVLVTAAFLSFALLVERAGLVPAVVVAIVLSSLASREIRLLEVVLLPIVTAASAYLIFRVGLGIQLEAFK